MRSERRPQSSRYWLVFVFLFLGTLTGVWHNRVTRTGGSDPIAGVTRGAVSAPADGLGRFSRWVSVQTGWVFHGYGVAAENRQLRERVAQLEGEKAALQEAGIKYEQLRADLGFVQNAKGRLLAADVTARRPDPKFDTLIINRGSRDGVSLNNIVVTRNGLVGRVFDVSLTSSSVLMLTDPNSGVGGRVQRLSSRATGVCKGDNSPLLTMVYLPNTADIKQDDVIVSSGLGGYYPAGLVIGTVLEVKPEAGNLLKQARVRPAVNFDLLEEVYVMRP